MASNQDRLSVVARNLRVLASAAENATEPRQMTGIIQGLQAAISLMALCMFSRQKKVIQNAAHDIDKNEMKEGGLL